MVRYKRLMPTLHRPVLLREVIELLGKYPEGTFADLTFGEGGHTEALLRGGAKKVVAYDRDLDALNRYREGGAFANDPRLELIHGRLSRFSQNVTENFDAILVDLGVSTRQLLTPERGFSFQDAGPLDMRMDQTQSEGLVDYLDSVTLEELTEGLERTTDLVGARRLARKLLERHQEGRLTNTKDIAALVPRHPGQKTHPATVLFLALRMLVNREDEEITHGILTLLQRLKPGGRLAVISFHSSEDRWVKRIFAAWAGKCICDSAPCLCDRTALVQWVNRKPLTASEDELRENPRSRSAKLRCIEKLSLQS